MLNRSKQDTRMYRKRREEGKGGERRKKRGMEGWGGGVWKRGGEGCGGERREGCGGERRGVKGKKLTHQLWPPWISQPLNSPPLACGGHVS